MKQKNSKESAAKTSKLKYIIIAAVSVVLAAAVIIGVITMTGSGQRARTKTAMTVDGQKVSVAEFDFYYMSYVNTSLTNYASYFTSMGFDLSQPFSDQMISDSQSLTDFFVEQTKDYVTQIVALSEKAKAEGIVLSDESRKKIDNQLENYRSNAKEQDKSLNGYLEGVYGPGVNAKLIRKAMEKYYLFDQYQQAELDKLEFNDTTYQEEYEKNRELIDTVDVRSTYIAAQFGEDATEDEKAAAMAEAKAKAEELESRITDEASFHAIAAEYAAEEEKPSFENDGYTLSNGLARTSFDQTAEFADWLFDPSRKEGDKLVSEHMDGYYVIYMISPVSRAEYNSVTCRNILVTPETDENGNVTGQTAQEAIRRAYDILDEYNGGEKTEEAFAALAVENSQDQISAANGGLYKQIGKNSINGELVDWIFDGSRKAGDVELIELSDGTCELLYFCGEDIPYWQVQVGAIIKNNRISELSNEAIGAAEVAADEAGMKAVTKNVSEIL